MSADYERREVEWTHSESNHAAKDLMLVLYHDLTKPMAIGGDPNSRSMPPIVIS